MAQIMILHYLDKDTLLHQMDSRLKVLSMVIVSLAVGLASKGWHYGVLFCLLSVAFGIARMPIRSWLKEMRVFVVIIVVVMGVHIAAGTGDPIVILPGPWFPAVEISGSGVKMGLVFAGRLLLVLMACSVMTTTTSPIMIRDVIEWYLRPVPLISGGRIATMVNLIFVLIPMILDNYMETREAQRSRCVDLRRNPVKKLYFIVFPLFSQMLRRADEIVYAMEARCYSEERTKRVFKARKQDWGVAGICFVILGLVLI